MRLSTRLSLLFVTALAVVLLGFSAALYGLAFHYLYRQLDEGLEAAINTLAAAAEISREGVEWEPRERSLTFARRAVEGRLVWQVRDDDGRRLDGSSAALGEGESHRENERVFDEAPDRSARHPIGIVDNRGDHWRILWRRLTPSAVVDPGQAPDAETRGLSVSRHAALILVAAVSAEGVQVTLGTLGLVLTGLSLAIWMLALLLGRRLGRRALRPLTAMAQAAVAIRGDEPHHRLPEPASKDELRELARSINGLLDRLQESFERQRRFTGDASHQLRTPLTSIQGHVDLALRQEREPEDYRRVLGLVQRKTRHLRQIVESLLFLARADGETLVPLLEPIVLMDWLASHLRSWGETHGEEAARVELEAKEALPVKVQPALLAELVNNLLDNAICHGGPAGPVRVRLRREGDWALLDVEDDGAGIASDDLPHLFEPFYRSATARSRGAPGVGLGLAVVRRLARSFGGVIEVASELGRGSRFTLRLPVANLVGPAVAAEPALNSPSRGSACPIPAGGTGRTGPSIAIGHVEV
jgi:signal transduction histidine kinase